MRSGREEAIPTLPLSDIEAFLRSRRVLDEEPRDLPYVLAIEENRLLGASGQVVYVRGAEFEPGQRWAIARPSVMFAKVTHPVIGAPRRIGEAWNRDKGPVPLDQECLGLLRDARLAFRHPGLGNG